jgi:putative peptide zinc metalloprotease protein
MKFDGYYLLSDWLGVPNLQERSFALGQWKLRKLLFGIEETPPEPIARSLRIQLTLYAWAAWLYRLVVFTGIALLVYHFFFKVLGLLLFAVEIAWFILLPIAGEARAWWRMQQRIIGSARLWLLLAGLAALVLIAWLPIPTRISLPAVLEADPHIIIYSPIPARVRMVAVTPGEFVRQGQTLALFEAPALEQDIAVTRKRIDVLRLKSNQAVASPEDLAKNDVVLEGLQSRLTELEGLIDTQNRLVLKAPIAGLVTDLEESLHPGRWVNEKSPLAHVAGGAQNKVQAMVMESDWAKLAVGASARFIPDDPLRPALSLRVQTIHELNEDTLTLVYLASLYGGDVPVRDDGRGRLKPERSIYRVLLDVVDKPQQLNQAVRGVVHIESVPQSFVDRAWKWVSKVLVQESGF